MQGEWPSLNHGMHHSQCILSLSYFTSRYFIIYKCSIKKKQLLFNKIVLTCKNTAILIGNNTQFFVGDGVNTIFNNILAISWQSVSWWRKLEYPEENHRPVASHCQTLLHNVVSSTPCHERVSN